MRTLRLKHDSEKACPGLDPGVEPVFGKDHAQTDQSMIPKSGIRFSGKIMRNKGAFYSMPKGSSLRIATAVQPFGAAPLAAGR
jgi:hypothetical protein